MEFNSRFKIILSHIVAVHLHFLRLLKDKVQWKPKKSIENLHWILELSKPLNSSQKENKTWLSHIHIRSYQTFVLVFQWIVTIHTFCICLYITQMSPFWFHVYTLMGSRLLDILFIARPRGSAYKRICRSVGLSVAPSCFSSTAIQVSTSRGGSGVTRFPGSCLTS